MHECAHREEAVVKEPSGEERSQKETACILQPYMHKATAAVRMTYIDIHQDQANGLPS